MNRLVSRPLLSVLCKHQNLNKLNNIGNSIGKRNLHDTIKNEYFWGLLKEEICYGYRTLNYSSSRKPLEVAAELGMGLFWYWFGWNMIYNWQHLVGEFVWPDYWKWTDEELGIPPLED